MLIKGRPVGIWILALWSAAHTIPGGLVAADIGAAKSLLAWFFVAAEAAVAVGLVMPWRIARYLVIVQLGVNVFVFALLAWAFVFVAIAWGLHVSEVPIVVTIAGYLLFVCWGFMYLFHPELQDYFASFANEPPI